MMSLPVEASLNGTLVCRQCQKVNSASRRFCGACGKGLREPCPQCGAPCAADERFCGSCGCNIEGGLADKTRQLEAALAAGRRLLSEFRYDEATACLQEAAAVADPRLEHLTHQAREEIQRIDAESRENRQAAEEALGRARKAIDAHDYQAAISELESVPLALHGQEALALLSRARSAQEELVSLCGGIRTALSQKRTDGLPRMVERLLALKPDHEQALAIAEQLKARLMQSAKKAMAAGEYVVALDQLRQIAPAVRSADVEALAEIAHELMALVDGVRGAALADPPTLALAQRLVKLVPANAEAAGLRDQLAEKAKMRPTDPRLGPLNFAPLPSGKLVGPPVDWLARPGRFVPADTSVAAALDEHPGQFFVALGLALQAFGSAAIALDLAPQEKTNLLTLDLTAALSLGKKVSPAWGLDLSQHALKAVKLVKDAGGKPQIAAALHLSGDQPLADFLSRAGELKGVRIAVGLPGSQVLGRLFDLPPLPAKKVADAIAYEARHQLPIPLEELCWASHVQDALADKTADESSRRILVVAARASYVRERIAALKAAGIRADCVASECLALHNALVHEMFGGDPAGQPAAVCGLDVGADGTNVVVSSPRCVWFRTFGQGGDAFTSQLVRQLALTKQQAEELKREPAKARRYSQFREAIQPTIVQLAGEVERSLASYAKLFPGYPVQHTYGLGGAFQTHGLLRQLRFGR